MSLRLQKGDEVALIAPASGQKRNDEHAVEQALQLLQSWGLSVRQKPVIQPQFYLAAEDSLRAESLKKALLHPTIKAIFTTRGGYGCLRLLPYLQQVNIASPRFLVGFSDITTLHLHWQKNSDIHAVHGLNLATPQCLANTEAAKHNRQKLHDYLFKGRLPELSLKPLYRVESPLDLIHTPKTGGCLSLLASSLATTHEVQTVGKILMIEEVAEPCYKIDRLLTQLKQAGKFDQCLAVVLGEFYQCGKCTEQTLSVIKAILSDIPCPVYHCQQFGHGAINLPWVYQKTP